MSSYSTIQNHRSMFFDDLRNSLYLEAINKIVKEDSVVLDLGAGLGLHGLMAARSGARKVYLVEPASIIDVTTQLINKNNLPEQVETISGKIEETHLPEKVDVIISVFSGNFLLTEDLLPSLFFARDKYLTTGGQLIPDRAAMEAVPVCAPEYYAKHIDCWNNELQGMNFDLVRNFAANDLYYAGAKKRKAEFLSEPAAIMELDFMTATEASCRNRIKVEVTQKGLCHGWLGWFRMCLGDKWFSTSPLSEQTHWRQVFLPLAEPIPLKKGDILSFELNRPEFGEWSWTVGKGERYQTHSTFLSQPVSPASLRRKSDSYKPQLSQKGRAARFVLQSFDGTKSTTNIVDVLMTHYQTLFQTRNIANQFVKNIAGKYSE